MDIWSPSRWDTHGVCSLGLRIRELGLRSSNGRPAAKGRHSATRENERNKSDRLFSHASCITRVLLTLRTALLAPYAAVLRVRRREMRQSSIVGQKPIAVVESTSIASRFYSSVDPATPCLDVLELGYRSRAMEDWSRGGFWQYGGKRTSHCSRARGKGRCDADMKGGWLTFRLGRAGARVDLPRAAGKVARH